MASRRREVRDDGRNDELPAWFYRLSARSQRTYLSGNAIDSFELNPDELSRRAIAELLAILPSGRLSAINQAAQSVVGNLCRELRIAAVQIEIRGVRPHSSKRELHGIFYPNARPPRMIVWMKTAQRHDLVKPKTFMRTLCHEFGHYLDYALFQLDDSFHNQGFFRRESFMMRVLYPQDQTARPKVRA